MGEYGTRWENMGPYGKIWTDWAYGKLLEHHLEKEVLNGNVIYKMRQDPNDKHPSEDPSGCRGLSPKFGTIEWGA